MSARALVCFAVPPEAKPFLKMIRSRSDIDVLVTGMGARNAEVAIRRALETKKPSQVFTCGFAGALDPKLCVGDVVYLTADPSLDAKLSAAGARHVSFFCSVRVVITATEKATLRQTTGTDAVEMESAAIISTCSEAGLFCSTVRAISDMASEDLPLDFNALMTGDQKLSPAKLALAILKAPQKIPALMRLGRNSEFAAKQLADVLVKVI